MGKKDIKYRYALNSKGLVVSIDEVPNEIPLRDEYTCLSCKLKLIAKKGKKRQAHFAHYPITKEEIKHIEKHCSFESYIHKLAKLKFKDLIQKYGLVIEIERKIVCLNSKDGSCKAYVKEFIDIKDIYKNFIVGNEVKIGSFIPDLSIVPLNDSSLPEIFVEIKVSHGISKKKATSKYPIIEIVLENETDIEQIEEKIVNKAPVQEEFISFKNLKGLLERLTKYEPCPEILYKNCPLNPVNQKIEKEEKKKSKKNISNAPFIKSSPRLPNKEINKKGPFFPTKFTEKDLPVKYKVSFFYLKEKYLKPPELFIEKLNQDFIGTDNIQLTPQVFITNNKTIKEQEDILYIHIDDILEIYLNLNPKSTLFIFHFREEFYSLLSKIYKKQKSL